MKLFPRYDSSSNSSSPTRSADMSGITESSFSSGIGGDVDDDSSSTAAGATDETGSFPPGKAKSQAAAAPNIMSGGTAAAGSPRTVRFDLGGGAEGPGSDPALLKKLTQAQADLAGERALRRRKEKTVVKLAKELNRRISDGEKKDHRIRELTRLLEEKERKLESVLTVATSLLGNRSSSPSAAAEDGVRASSSSSPSMEIRRRLMTGDREPRAAAHLVPVEPASGGKIRAAAGWSILLALSAAAAAAAAACVLREEEGADVFAFLNVSA